MLRIECGLLIAAVLFALITSALGARFLKSAERSFSRLAEKPRLAVLVVGLFALATRAALLPVLPIPEPIVRNEFGYVLQADTFSRGRLTNPTPPMGVSKLVVLVALGIPAYWSPIIKRLTHE